MRTQFKRSVVLGAMLLGLGAGSAWAEELAVVSIPFPFVVRGQTLPAGKYEVRSNDDAQSILMIEGKNGNKSHAIVLTNAEYGRDPAGNKPALTFVKRENQYRLNSVWETSDYAREIPVR
jgi:hypothetical protein